MAREGARGAREQGRPWWPHLWGALGEHNRAPVQPEEREDQMSGSGPRSRGGRQISGRIDATAGQRVSLVSRAGAFSPLAQSEAWQARPSEACRAALMAAWPGASSEPDGTINGLVLSTSTRTIGLEPANRVVRTENAPVKSHPAEHCLLLPPSLRARTPPSKPLRSEVGRASIVKRRGQPSTLGS